jgi:hypothetical protein
LTKLKHRNKKKWTKNKLTNSIKIIAEVTEIVTITVLIGLASTEIALTVASIARHTKTETTDGVTGHHVIATTTSGLVIGMTAMIGHAALAIVALTATEIIKFVAKEMTRIIGPPVIMIGIHVSATRDQIITTNNLIRHKTQTASSAETIKRFLELPPKASSNKSSLRLVTR